MPGMPEERPLALLHLVAGGHTACCFRDTLHVSSGHEQWGLRGLSKHGPCFPGSFRGCSALPSPVAGVGGWAVEGWRRVCGGWRRFLDLARLCLQAVVLVPGVGCVALFVVACLCALLGLRV